MIRSFLLIPILYRFRTLIYQYKPFVFPDGCRPNIHDPSTFETNYTVSDIEIESVLNYTLANDTKWEEEIEFNKTKPTWENMMKFGTGEA
jgi:hypothetical protein